ncbi:MAG: xanthine dehydrogenase family protein molybdopterin-binding subunit, partial [Hyphococcus sp.]
MDGAPINTTRRDLFRYAAAGGALAIAAPLAACSRRPDEESSAETITSSAVGPFLVINSDETVQIAFPNPEMGQGVDTSLPMIVAEELDADFDKVSVVQMPLAIRVNDEGDGYTWKHIAQGSGGSYSIVGRWDGLRRAGALARSLLVAAAAAEWGVPPEEITVDKGVLRHTASRRETTFGAVAEAAGQMPEPSGDPTLKDQSKFSLIGTPQKMKNARAIVTGKAIYGLDAELPGMVHAVIERAPTFDARVRNIDDTAARAVAGVIDIMKLDGPAPGAPYHILAEGVAVVADSLWAAMKGREALRVEWDNSPYADESTASFKAHCEELLAGTGQIVRNDGDLAGAFANAATTHEAYYWQPYVSHAPMEPQNCIAHVREDGVDIIGPTQMPGGANRAVASALGVEDRLSITVTPTRLGGGFGRRLSNDYAVEAALVSNAIRRPVKVVWTREDDMRNDFYRPSGMHHLRAAFDENGMLTGWAHRLASASKYYRRPNLPETDYWQAELYTDDFPAQLVENMQLEYFSARSGAPRGSWRAPAHTANAFVVQSFLDEIAHARGEDPLALRLRILGAPRELPYENHGGPTFNPGRLAGVLRLAAERGGYGEPM